MGGDHKCPVCGSTFTRSQHVARHMRSHTGDRPYKCVHCGDQFARSDLLSRHVNKCHSTEKKPGPVQNNARRKPKQLSVESPATQPPGQSFSHPAYGQPAQLDSSISPDPFSNVYHSSPRRNSAAQSIEAGDPPSLTSSSLASNSSASASVDSLPHSATEPVFHLPQHHYNPPGGLHRQWGSQPYQYMQSFDPSAPVNETHQYNDLRTPVGYPGAQYRPNSSEQLNNTLDPFIPNHYSSMQTFNGPPLDSTAYMPNLPHSQPTSSTQAGNVFTRGEGTSFSSAFGLMSLDDASVLAGISADGAPFFEHAMAGTNGVADLQAFFAQNQHASFMQPEGNNAQTPNSGERENMLKDLWATFLRDPTTGLKPDGTEMGRPEFPSPAHPQLHRRSSSYGGSGSIAKAAGQPINGHLLSMQQQPGDFKNGSMSQGLQIQGNVVQRLEDQVAKLEAVAIPASTVFSGNPDSLKNYEEAILSRKAPVLKLPAKMKGREGAALSSILPSISGTGRAPGLGGGVASLIMQQQSLATAAGASSVPVGSNPHTAFQQHLQAYGPGERPIIAMPKPRSRRPSNATGPPSRPTSATSGAITSVQNGGFVSGNSSDYGSRPSSRPGTASSTGPGYQNPPGPAHVSSPQMQHAHSQPNSRPSTAAGMSSPSHNFAYAPPGIQYGMSPTGAAYNFQPGSLPPESSLSPTHQNLSSLSSAMMDSGATTASRPNYKRLASQTLEPASAKRPHFRRGDTNFNPTPEDGFESEGGSDAGSIHSERSYSGHEHAYASAGPNGYGRPWGVTMPMNGYGASARRMSEPTVTAPRMAMRMPAGAAKP